VKLYLSGDLLDRLGIPENATEKEAIAVIENLIN
jgi:hypothetical protein